MPPRSHQASAAPSPRPTCATARSRRSTCMRRSIPATICRRRSTSMPIGLGVSCSADRQILGKITAEGVFLEELESNPARFLPEIDEAKLGGEVVRIDLTRPMAEIRRTLSQHPIKTRLALTGPLIVARDIPHAKLKERLDPGEGRRPYAGEHAIYYAGPAN